MTINNKGCQTDDIEEEIVHEICQCHKCCFANRQNDPAYLFDIDDQYDECICHTPNEKVNYFFLVPFILSLSLGVM